MSTRIASRRLVETLPISRPSQYICRACRRTTHISQQRRHASDEPSGEPKSFLEKTRSKLWKGAPPGPENIDDVYGGPGFFAEMKKDRKRNLRRKESRESIPIEERQVPTPKVSQITEEESVFRAPAQTQAEFIERAGDAQSGLVMGEDTAEAAPAEEIVYTEGTLAADVRFWEGLDVIGHQGDWKEMPEMPVDDYTPWQKMDKELKWTRNELISLMAIAAEDGEMVDANFSPGDADLSQLSEDAKSTLLSQPLQFSGEESHATLKLLSRFSYLVRRRIPDPVLTKISRKSTSPTVQDFLDMFDAKTKPKPTKIAEILMSNEKLGMHGNLLVFGRKEDMVDKEQEIGRWKVIEAELRDRDLPIPGQPVARRLHGFEKKVEQEA